MFDDTKNSKFKLKNTTNGVVNPSYLGLVKNDFVYSVNENGRKVSFFSYSPITES
jgi:6-phosphogluconolactonase (cycloisomerase 2 family)